MTAASWVGRRQQPDSRPGSYALLMYLRHGQSVTVGRLGPCDLFRGWYLYVGSAFGPGGVAARCNHHRRISRNPRWHVDYLRRIAPLRAIWFTYAKTSQEHRWAAVFRNHPGVDMPLLGFGASDCDCPSHLYRIKKRPDLRHFSILLQSQSEQESPVYCEIL